MDDAPLVRGVESLDDLSGDRKGVVQLEAAPRTALAPRRAVSQPLAAAPGFGRSTPDQLGQRRALDELNDIAASASVILWESLDKLLDPRPMAHAGWVAAAAVAGFAGNEGVALLQIRRGRQLGSAAMVADGQHARIDAWTSLAVLPAAAASPRGWLYVDPIVGLAIGVAILFIARDAILAVWYRLMDAVDPDVMERAERALARGARECVPAGLRIRWIGHRLEAEVRVRVDPGYTAERCDAIRRGIEGDLRKELPNLQRALVQVEPRVA